MRQTSFLYNLVCVQIIEMMPEVSESNIRAFIQLISLKMKLKQSQAIGKRLYYSVFFFIIFIKLSEFVFNQYNSLLYKNKKNMDHQEKQDNNMIREIRKKQIQLYVYQKKQFQSIFYREMQPNFTLPQYYSLIMFGIPSQFRNYIWTQLIPNIQNIQPETYKQIIKYIQDFNEWIIKKQKVNFEANNNKQLMLCQCDKPIQNQQKRFEQNSNNPQANQDYHMKIQLWLKNIRMDIPRTFPELKTLHIDNDQLDKLQKVLSAFVIYKQQIGYIQGLSSIAALLLQELNTQFRTFVAFTNLLSTTPLFIFYTFDQKRINQFHQNMMKKMKTKLARLYNFFIENNLDIKAIIVGWIMNLFTRLFKFDSILCIWDILFVNKVSLNILEQLCLAILSVKKQDLLKCEQDTQIMKLLSVMKISTEEEEFICEKLRQIYVQSI